jgi:tetratricopeptide (TPR) repeat protein
MTRLQKLLLLVIGLELAATAWLAARRTAPLPVSRLEAIEESAVVQIRELEASTARRSPEDWLKLAEIYLAFGRIPEADYCFAQVDRFRLANPDYLYFWGTCLSRYGATTEARIRYERAIAAGSRLAPFCWFRIGLDRLRDENPRRGPWEFPKRGCFLPVC